MGNDGHKCFISLSWIKGDLLDQRGPCKNDWGAPISIIYMIVSIRSFFLYIIYNHHCRHWYFGCETCFERSAYLAEVEWSPESAPWFGGSSGLVGDQGVNGFVEQGLCWNISTQELKYLNTGSVWGLCSDDTDPECSRWSVLRWHRYRVWWDFDWWDQPVFK